MQRIQLISTLLLAVQVTALAQPAKKRPPKTLAVEAREVEDSGGNTPIGPGASGSKVVRAQILLDRARFSPGEIDGRYGGALEIAIKGYQEKHGLTPTGTIDAAMWEVLNADKGPLLVAYTITAEDVGGPFEKIPKEPIQQAQLKRLGYESAREKLAEKFHVSPEVLSGLNPGKNLAVPGEQFAVPDVQRTRGAKAERVVVSKSKRTVAAYNAEGNLLAQYPASMGGVHDPLPIGKWRITAVQRNPWFFYNPEHFWNADPNAAKAKLPPGPNNPAGVVWIGISKPHYGIHGTPEPGLIRHKESYGCIRLTNWDADDLAHMVRAGTPAILEE